MYSSVGSLIRPAVSASRTVESYFLIISTPVLFSTLRHCPAKWIPNSTTERSNNVYWRGLLRENRRWQLRAYFEELEWMTSHSEHEKILSLTVIYGACYSLGDVVNLEWERIFYTAWAAPHAQVSGCPKDSCWQRPEQAIRPTRCQLAIDEESKLETWGLLRSVSRVSLGFGALALTYLCNTPMMIVVLQHHPLLILQTK